MSHDPENTTQAPAIREQAQNATEDIPRVYVKRMTFGNGSQIELGSTDVLIVVGPNNAGKSAMLRGIDTLVQQGVNNAVINGVELARQGSADALRDWMLRCAITRQQQPGQLVVGIYGVQLGVVTAQNWWNGTGPLYGMKDLFCQLLDGEHRLHIANPPKNMNFLEGVPVHPIQYLYRDETLEQKVSEHFRKAFGFDLVVNRSAGDNIPLHVGTRPIPDAHEDRLSLSYMKRLEKLPTLHQQGDGMRSFAGIMLATSTGTHTIALIDEPEAFLHPPQARLLGLTLVDSRSNNRQLVIATHSSDILRGVLDSRSSDIRVIRITRLGDANAIRLLDNSRVRELWEDPLLRYSNILDGLFHDGVIVCESDADCRFYSAVRDALTLSDQAKRRPDVMFTHCGGKDRLKVVIRALREVGVPVKAVADFDILSGEKTLREVVESLGADWSDISTDWRTVKSAIDGKKPELSTQEVSEQIELALKGVADPIFPHTAKDRIQGILRRSSPWSTAKEAGKAFVPHGQPAQAYQRLSSKLGMAGLLIVEVGELENFCRTEGSHGPKWVNAVLNRDLAQDPELAEARTFVKQILE